MDTHDVTPIRCKNLEVELAAMASDPDIQREIREIEQEFAGTEEDGLENA